MASETLGNGLDARAVTLIVPAIRPRLTTTLPRALRSAFAQTEPPRRVVVALDDRHDGPAAVRNAALAQVDTEWVAFLDDDDELYPTHLELLITTALVTGSDVAYPWFDVVGGSDPLGRFGAAFDAAHLRSANYIPVTVLARTGLVREVGGFAPPPFFGGAGPTCEDWGLWLKLLDAGATFVHLPERTWAWHHHGGNTGGRTDRW